MFPKRDHPEQKCRGGCRPDGEVERGFHPERTSHRQRETEQQRRRRECPPMKPPPDQQSNRDNHFCCRRQDGRRRHQGGRQEPQESGGVGGESFKVAPCHPAAAKLAPQAEAIGNRGEEREGQGHAKQPDREPAKLRLVEHGSSPRADYFFGYSAADHQVLNVLDAHDGCSSEEPGRESLLSKSLLAASPNPWQSFPGDPETLLHKSVSDPSPAILAIRLSEVFRRG